MASYAASAALKQAAKKLFGAGAAGAVPGVGQLASLFLLAWSAKDLFELLKGPAKDLFTSEERGALRKAAKAGGTEAKKAIRTQIDDRMAQALNARAAGGAAAGGAAAGGLAKETAKKIGRKTAGLAGELRGSRLAMREALSQIPKTSPTMLRGAHSMLFGSWPRALLTLAGMGAVASQIGGSAKESDAQAILEAAGMGPGGGGGGGNVQKDLRNAMLMMQLARAMQGAQNAQAEASWFPAVQGP